jgi:hypothetical protein
VHRLVLATNYSISTPILFTKAVACSLQSVSATLRPINQENASPSCWTARCHQAVGGGTACGWCVGDTMAGTAARDADRAICMALPAP